MSQTSSAKSPELHKLSRQEPLRCPLWLALIHLVVVEMINMLLINQEKNERFLFLQESIPNQVLNVFSSKLPTASFTLNSNFRDSLREDLSTVEESISNSDDSHISFSALISKRRFSIKYHLINIFLYILIF